MNMPGEMLIGVEEKLEAGLYEQRWLISSMTYPSHDAPHFG